jgi:hypothetical protein
MATRALDAIALASFDTPTRVQRIAAYWCRACGGRRPESWEEIADWVDQEFGPLLDSEHHEQLAELLLEETNRQIRLRSRRKRNQARTDPLTTPAGDPARISALLHSRLGPARHWASQRNGWGNYIDGAVYQGLVAGLIPVTMQLRRFVNPCLLVYRQGQNAPKSWWVPGHITTVADAFVWVIPPEVAEFLKLPDTRVEHDGETQRVRLITPFGTKSVPWRRLVSTV